MTNKHKNLEMVIRYFVAFEIMCYENNKKFAGEISDKGKVI